MKLKNQSIPVVKNQEIYPEIVDLTDKGEGVGKYKGFTIMVPGVLPGERALVKVLNVRSSFAYGKVISLEKTSKDRVRPFCPLDGKCGGCQLGHLSYEAQLLYKRNKVRQDLVRIGHFEDSLIDSVMTEKALGMSGEEANPWLHYRNKAQFPVQMVDGCAQAGFYAPRSHRLLPTEDCRIQSEKSNELIHKIMEEVRSIGLPVYDEEKHQGILRHVLIRTAEATGQVSVCFVINADTIPNLDKWRTFMKAEGVTGFSLNINREKTNVILGRKTVSILGELQIEDKIDDLTFRISPVSFYQVNSRQMEVLYQKALEFADLHGTETVWDAYCGIGTISLFMARHAGKVYGVEIVPDAIENAKENAIRNELTNSEFFVGKAEEVIPEMYKEKGIKADVIMVDPPRSGIERPLLDTILEMAPEKVVYVSCDPATLARDLDHLCHSEKSAGLYRLEKVQAVDMFPNTAHVETVVLLRRK